MPKNARAILGILLIFLLGAASGALLTHMIHRSHLENFISGGPAAREEFIVKRLSRSLDLDSRQQDQIRGIIHETHGVIREIRRQMRPRIEAELEQSQGRISAVLRPEQREKFLKILAERKARKLKESPPPQ